MNDRDIMKQALDALENSVDLVREDAYQAEKLYGNYPTRQGKVNGLKVLADDHEKAITALCERLAQPEQKPVAYIEHHKGGDNLEWENPGGKYTPLYDTPPAAAHMTEFEEAVAAVDNTLHHAIDYWQDRAMKAEALLAKPEQEPVAYLHQCRKKPELKELSFKKHEPELFAKGYKAIPLSDATPPAAQRKPLTDDERDLIRRMQGPIERLQAALHTLPDRGLSAMVAGQLQVAPSNKQ